MPAAGFLGAIGIIMGSVLMGLVIIGYGNIMLAIRETALNTRKQENPNQYKGLEIIGVLIGVFGWIVIIGGVVLGGLTLFASFQM